MTSQVNKAEEFIFKPIGHIQTAFPDKFGVPRQSGLVPQTISVLEIRSEWQPELALQGLEGYSHVWVSFVFHLNTNTKYHPKVHPPRLKGETIGVFATRSPHRPNPLGLSLCKVIKIEKNKIYLGGADLVDGTPILDIKPYLPQYESKPEALGGWATQDEHKVQDIQVIFSELARTALETWIQKTHQIDLETIIVEVLKQDPRPVVYRGFEGTQDSPYRNQHAFRLYDGDIHFEFTSVETVVVTQIVLLPSESV